MFRKFFFYFPINTKHHVLANIRVFRTFTNEECFIFIKHASLRISLFTSLFDLNDDTVTLMRNN